MIEYLLSFSVLLSFRNLYKLNCFIIVCFYHFFNFIQSNIKELPSSIDHVNLFVFKSMVKCCFKSWSIIRKDKSMHIKFERYRCITKLINSFHRIKSSCHTYLIDILTK